METETPVTSDDAPQPGPTATRRRGEGLLRAIFAATIDQLGACGYSGLTMEGVALCAGTGKASLYRRWPTKDELIIDAISNAVTGSYDAPETGSVRGDILAILGGMSDMITSAAGRAIYALIRGNARERDFVRLAKIRLMQPRQAQVLEVLRRGAERGEVRPEAVSPLVAQVGIAMIGHLIMLNDGALSRAELTAIVDEILLPLVLTGRDDPHRDQAHADQPSKSSTTASAGP